MLHSKLHLMRTNTGITLYKWGPT